MTPVVFINCTVKPYINDIMSHMKEYETRNRNTLGRFLGERILLAETGSGSPLVRSSAVIDRIIAVYTRDAWMKYADQTCVPVDSKHDWKSDTTVKYLYHLVDVHPVAPFRLPASSRRHGRVWAEYDEGSALK